MLVTNGEGGRLATIQELAATEKINWSNHSRIPRLTLLALDIIEAILDGRQAEGMTLLGLREGIEPDWRAQRVASVRFQPRCRHSPHTNHGVLFHIIRTAGRRSLPLRPARSAARAMPRDSYFIVHGKGVRSRSNASNELDE